MKFFKSIRWIILREKIMTVAAFLLLALLFIAMTFLPIRKKEETAAVNDFNEIFEDSTYEAKEVFIELRGEVKNPGVYSLKSGSKISDAISCAGGTTQNADLTHIAENCEISDGTYIYIPHKHELSPKLNPTYYVVYLNMADEKELQKLEGIGEKLSRRIVNYRDYTLGEFSDTKQLLQVEGFTDALYIKLLPQLKL